MTPDERRAYQREYKRRRYQTDPEYRRKHRARVAARDAVRYGRMQKKPCQVCGTEVGVHMHHGDYDRPLDVVWLCEAHHGTEHGKTTVGTNPADAARELTRMLNGGT